MSSSSESEEEGTKYKREKDPKAFKMLKRELADTRAEL